MSTLECSAAQWSEEARHRTPKQIPPYNQPQSRELNAPNLAFHINMALKLESVQRPGLDYPAPLVRRIADALKPTFDSHAALQTWLEVDGTTVQVSQSVSYVYRWYVGAVDTASCLYIGGT